MVGRKNHLHGKTFIEIEKSKRGESLANESGIIKILSNDIFFDNNSEQDQDCVNHGAQVCE